MQLLIVSDTLAGGMGAVARAHASWFASRGWNVTVAAPPDGPAPDARFLELPPLSSMRRLREVVGVRQALRRASATDVVHAHGMRAFALCRLAALPKPFVTVHGTHPAEDDPAGYHRIRRAFFTLLPPLARVAMSVEPTDVRGWVYRPIASPLLGRLSNLPFPAASSVPTVAWLGLLDHRKQPEVFVRAIAAVASRGVAIRGVMGGGGDRFEEIRSLIASLDAPIELRGPTDAVAVLRDAWALALFSHSEGTPLAVMEAMWAGRPVVASNLPGTAHLIGETGALADDVEAAAAWMEKLAGDHLRAAALGQEAAARVRTLVSPDTPWAELAALYGT